MFYCKYCNKEYKSIRGVRSHEILCKYNPNKKESPFIKYNKSENKKILGQSNQYTSAKYNGLPQPILPEDSRNRIAKGWKGKHHTEDQKLKTRLSTIKYIESCKGGCKPRYNKRACQYINQLNKEKNWNLQHAENGGEYQFNGYFVDGYDKDLNIVFEYDEYRHYKDKENNILYDKDIQRQNNLIKELNCEFWRYNEYLDLLYKVV